MIDALLMIVIIFGWVALDKYLHDNKKYIVFNEILVRIVGWGILLSGVIAYFLI